MANSELDNLPRTPSITAANDDAQSLSDLWTPDLDLDAQTPADDLGQMLL